MRTTKVFALVLSLILTQFVGCSKDTKSDSPKPEPPKKMVSFFTSIMDNLPEYTSIDVYVTLGRYRPPSVASAPESCSETSALEAGRQYQPYTLKLFVMLIQ